MTDGTVQIYVKVNGGKLVPTEVNLMDDKVEDVVRQFLSSEDMYVTMQGRVLKRSEKLKSCGVTDGCTIQVTSRLRGGGRHKVKKRKESAKTERMEHRVDQKDDEVEGVVMDSAQPMEERLEQRWAEDVKGDKTPVMRECDKDAYVQMIEQTEVYRKIVDEIWRGNDFEVEWLVQEYMRMNRETLGWTLEQAEMMGCGLRWAVEARKKGRGPEKEQRRREEPLEEMRTESTDEPEVTSRVAEVKTGRGSASLVQGGVDGHDELDETRGKGKGKGNGGKGDKRGKGFQQSAKMMKGEEEMRSEENETQKELKGEEEQETAEEDEGRVRMAPNMGAGGSHPQATTDPEEKKQRQGGQWVLRPTREWREWRSELSLVGKWADCVDEEPEEEAEDEDKHEAEDEREEKKAEELSRRTEEAGGRSSEEHVTEEEAEERESRGSEGREEEVKGEEEAGQGEEIGEEIGEKPPGLEEVKSKLETQEEEKQSQVKSEQEAREEKQSQVESEQEVQKEKRRDDEGRGEEGETGEEEGRTQEARSEEKRGEARRSEEKRGETKKERRRSEERRGCTRHERKRWRLRKSRGEK